MSRYIWVVRCVIRLRLGSRCNNIHVREYKKWHDIFNISDVVERVQ